MKRRLEQVVSSVEDAAPIVEEHPLCFALRQLPVAEALARAFYSETYGNDYCRHYDEREYDSRDVGVYTAVHLLCTTRTLAAALAFGDENVSATVHVLRRLIDGARIGRYTYNAYDTSRTCEWIVRHAWHMDLVDYHETLTSGRRWCAPPKPRPIQNTWQLSAMCLNVRTLKFDHEQNLANVDTLCHLPHLENLHIERCYRLERADGVAACPKLRILQLDGCTELALSSLQSAPPLENLTVDYCDDVQFLRTCRTLRTVYLWQGKELKDLRPFSASAQTLCKFKIFGCPNLRSLNGLEQCSELRHVSISQCDQLYDVTAIGGMTRLETLNLFHCNAVQDASAVSRCIMLRTLHISSKSMEEMPVLGACTQLHKVNVTFCRRLRSLNGVYACPALRTMTASACDSLVDIAAIASCEALEELDLSGGCCSLRDIAVVGACAALRSLDLAGCTALTDVSALERCTSLRTLSLSGCDSLRGVRLGTVTRDRPLQWLRHQRTLYDQRRARNANKQ